jgi:hypothetical protein
MTLQRSYARQLMLSLFDKEATYDAGPSGWTSNSACLMQDMDEASAVVQWDDLVQANADVITGREFVTTQEIARYSTRLTYTEPRCKPNTLAGLMGLCLGTIAATQDGSETAYRHKITKATSVALPSIAGQVKHEGGDQRLYTGLKGEQFTFAINGAYFSFGCGLVGSGKRGSSATAFVASISEHWLRVGDAKFFIKDTGGSAISTSGAPTQGSANLGGSEVNLSTRVRTFSLTWNNAPAVEAGYRASTGLYRGDFYPVRRASGVQLSFDCDTADEATRLGNYLSQTQLAFEVNVDSGVLVDPDGAFKYGLIVIIPRLQLKPLVRGATDEMETLMFDGEVMDDGTNSELVAYVYNAQAAYLA